MTSSLHNVTTGGTRRTVRIALMTAAAVASGYLLIAIPNVELVTATVAMAGLMMGPLPGAIVGTLAMAIFGSLNIFGIPYPPVWLTQMLGEATTGVLFGLVRFSYDRANPLRRAWIGGSLAAAATLFYDLITNLAFPAGLMVPLSSWWPYLIAGIPFAITHLVSNVLIFALVVPVAWSRIGRRYMEKRPSS
ncbi:MAG: ECF transporter S component [bacterium]